MIESDNGHSHLPIIRAKRTKNGIVFQQLTPRSDVVDPATGEVDYRQHPPVFVNLKEVDPPKPSNKN